MSTKVVFRRWPKKEGGGVIALFPEEVCDFQGHVTSYEHIGQHGGADYPSVIRATRPTHPDTDPDAATLFKELQAIGYDDLVVRRKA